MFFLVWLFFWGEGGLKRHLGELSHFIFVLGYSRPLLLGEGKEKAAPPKRTS